MSTTDALSTTEAVQTEAGQIEFVDELPKVSRQREGGGRWAELLRPLYNDENRGKWAKLDGPTNNPHATVNNLRSGNVATGDIDVKDFTFAGRILGTHTEVDTETGEEVEVKEGYIFGRYDTPEQREEREEQQAKRAAARAANQSDESEEE